MIQVKVRLGIDGITSYRSQGHAGNQPGNGLVVCNGLSTMEYQFLYATKTLCPKWAKSGANFEIGKGKFHLNLNKLPEGEEIQIYRTLSKSLIIGLEMLEKHHSHEINVIMD